MHIILDTTKGILEVTVKLRNNHMIINNWICLDFYFLISRRHVPVPNDVIEYFNVF